MIAQCLAAGQHTVADDFYVHSMHCYGSLIPKSGSEGLMLTCFQYESTLPDYSYCFTKSIVQFVNAGNASMPLIFHVERVRDGRSYQVRTVQARQRGNVIFTTTMSFVKANSAGEHLVEHAYTMPDVPGPGPETASRLPQGVESPFTSQQIDIFNNDAEKPHTKRARQWIKTRGKISEAGGHEAHLAALAYMSDSYFIGTISRVHKLWHVPRPAPREQKDKRSPQKDSEREDIVEDEDVLAEIRKAGPEKIRQLTEQKKILPQVGMMVSLDHTIYFHNPRSFRADEWLFTEMESPWAGDGRGLVIQRIWTKDGILVATCVQEVSTSNLNRGTELINLRVLCGWRQGARAEASSRYEGERSVIPICATIHISVMLNRSLLISYRTCRFRGPSFGRRYQRYAVPIDDRLELRSCKMA